MVSLANELLIIHPITAIIIPMVTALVLPVRDQASLELGCFPIYTLFYAPSKVGKRFSNITFEYIIY